MGEDSTAPGLVGALRDMHEPNCYGNPNRVSDPLYWCSTDDQGGVHINSGVDNRAFSLLVDGGTHNGETVNGIGLTKATHIWYRAKVAYQHPATDFADHADALEQACDDLIGRNLRSLATGAASGQKITANNCRQLKRAVRAVEFRTAPEQCGFQPLLAQDPPAVCPPSGNSPRNLFSDNFERPARSAKLWTVSDAGTTPDFTERAWSIVNDLPDERGGKAFFGPDFPGGTCGPGGDETAVLYLDGPAIEVPSSGNIPRVSFDHWVATEYGWDGGNVQISVNGGAYAARGRRCVHLQRDTTTTLITAPAATPTRSRTSRRSRATTTAPWTGTWGTLDHRPDRHRGTGRHRPPALRRSATMAASAPSAGTSTT